MSETGLHLPSLNRGPSPIGYCRKGKFDELFALLDTRKKEKKKLYQPHTRKQCLLYAAAQGNCDAVRLLVDNYNCNPRFLNDDGISPLRCAVVCGHIEIVKFLFLRGCSPKTESSESDQHGSKTLLYACNPTEYHKSMAKFSLHESVDATHDHVEILKLLFEHGWKLVKSDHDALHRGYYYYYSDDKVLKILRCILSSGTAGDLKNFLDCDFLSKEELKTYFTKSERPSVVQLCGIEMIEFLVTEQLLTITVVLIRELIKDISEKVCLCLIKNCSEDVYSTNLGYSHLAGQYNEISILLDYSCAYKLLSVSKAIVQNNLNSVDPAGRTPLHVACSHNDIELVSFLIENQCDQSIANCNGHLATHVACKYGSFDLVKLLAFTDVDKPNNSSNTCLHIACERNDYDIVKYLVREKKSSVNQVNGANLLPLHVAVNQGHNASLDIIKMVSKSVNVNLPGKDGCTPAHLASSNYNLKVLDYLACEKQCKLDLMNERGKLPLNSILEGSSEVVEIIVKILGCNEYNVNAQDKWGNTLLHVACSDERNLDLVRYLVVEKKCDVAIENENGDLPLHIACKHLLFEVVKLVSSKLETHKFLHRNGNGKTALHIACYDGSYYSYSYRNRDKSLTRKTIVKHLIEKGCVPIDHPKLFCDLNILLACADEKDFDILLKIATADNVNPEYGYQTPLKCACANNNIEAVRLFTQELKCKVGKDEHLLHIACEYSSEMVELLVQHIDIDDVNYEGETPLHVACKLAKVDIIKLLVCKYKCNQSVLNENNEYPLHLACAHSLDAVKILETRLECLKHVSREGLTPLHIACKHNKLDIVQYLVNQLSNDISSIAECGTVHLLRLACESGNDLLVKYLIENGANTFEKFTDGNTALHLACSCGSFVIAKFLIDNGHSTSITNAKNELPVHIACTKGLELVEITSHKCTHEELESKTNNDVAPLHIAVSSGKLEIVKYLIEEKECNPFTVDYYGNNALAHACGGKQYYSSISTEVIKYLVDRGCSPMTEEIYISSTRKFSPIHLAINKKNYDLFEALLRSELSINSFDNDGNTSLILICKEAVPAKKKVKYDKEEELFILKAMNYLVCNRKCDQLVQNSKNEYALHIACRSGNLELVKLLDSRCILLQDGAGDTALHIACQKNSLPIFKHLFKQVGSTFSVRNKKFQSILHLAVISNNSEIVKLLAEKLQDFFFLSVSRDSKGLAPVHYAKSASVLQVLLDHDDSNVNLADSYGNSPLHSYIMSPSRKDLDSKVKLLLSVGASVHAKNNDGNTPLHLACSVKPVKRRRKLNCSYIVPIVQQLLVHEASIVSQNNDGNTPLHLACNATPLRAHGNKKLKKKLINLTDKERKRMERLNQVTSSDYIIPVIKSLLTQQTSVTDEDIQTTCILIQNNDGDTALHIACANASFPIVDALLQSCKSSDLFTIKNNHGDIPFHVALELFQQSQLGKVKKSRGSLELFASNCSDINIENGDDQTLLHLACKVINEYSVHLVEFFVNKGADLQKTDSNKQLPLHITASKSLEKLKLCCRKCIVDYQDEEGNTPLHIACINSKRDIANFLLEDMKCNPILKNKKDQTPFHCACIDSTNEVIILLAKYTLKHEASMCLQDKLGNTPLHTLSRSSNLKCISSLNNLEYNFGDISIQNEIGETPLHVVCGNSSSSLELIESVIKCDPASKLKDKPCDTALQLACRNHSHQIIKYLIQNGHESAVKIVNYNEELPIHILCEKNNIDTLSNITLLMECSSSFNQQRNNGDTPLHIGLKNGLGIEIIKYLINIAKCDITITNNQEELALHIGCRDNKELGLLKLLVSKEIVNARNAELNTALHLCCGNKSYAMESMISYLLDIGAKKNLANASGKYPMHLACHYSSLSVVKCLEPHGLTAKSKDGNTVFHEACLNTTGNAFAIVQYLFDYQPELDYKAVNSDGDLAVHIACRNSTLRNNINFIVTKFNSQVNYTNKNGNTVLHELMINEQSENLILFLIKKENLNLEIVNNHKETILHLACRNNLVSVVHYLLTERLSEVQKYLNFENDKSQTPLVLTANNSILQKLLDCGASAEPLYKMHDHYFHKYGINSPPEMPVSFLVVGHPEAGKTTLVKSLKNEKESVKSETLARTAGIVPTNFNSDEYGQVTIYDFAGQPEYYTSHDAIIHSTIKKSPPIVILVVDLTLDLPKTEKIVSHWRIFVKNRLTSLTDRAHLYIVCSHSDVVKERGEDPEQRSEALLVAVEKKLKEVEVYDFKNENLITMDCTKSQSREITKLRECLSFSSKQLRKKGAINFESHCLSTFIAQTFKTDVVIPMEKLIFKTFQASKNGHNLVPKDLNLLKKICQDLNDCSIIIFLENKNILERSWLVLDKNALLSHVSGILFAPSSFPEYVGVYGTNTGVVTFSKLRDLFSQYDPNMLFGFLCQMEYCQEIVDDDVKHILKMKEISSSDKYYFFPNVVRVKRPSGAWNDKGYQFGWTMECENDDEQFSSYFVQILLLRLMFGKTRIKNLSRDFHSMSEVWKSGLMWSNEQGIDTIVDVVEHSKVLVLMTCNEKSCVKLLGHRSSVLNLIRSVKTKICPALNVCESLIHPDCITFPLAPTASLISFVEVFDTVLEGGGYVSNKIDLDTILFFDPYKNLCDHLLSMIQSLENSHKKPSNALLEALAGHLYNYYLDVFLELIHPSAAHQAEIDKLQSPSAKLFKLFKILLHRKHNTVETIRIQFDKITIFDTESKLPACKEGIGCSCSSVFVDDRERIEKTMEEYVSSLSDQTLWDRQLDWNHDGVDEDLYKIAFHMIGWERKYSTHLGLTGVNISDIKEKFPKEPELQRREALKIWKNKKGLNATYKSLLKIFVIAEDTECSEAVCEVLGAQ